MFVCAFYRRSTLKFTLTLKLLHTYRAHAGTVSTKRETFVEMAANFLKYVLYQKYLIIQAETFYIVHFFGSKVGFLLANTDMTAKKTL